MYVGLHCAAEYILVQLNLPLAMITNNLSNGLSMKSSSTIGPLRSADSHIIEPAGLWQDRVDKKFRDRAPRVVNGIDGMRGRLEGEWMLCEGLGPQRVAGFAAADVEDPKLRKTADERGYKDLRPGAWDPVERLKDQDIDGVVFEVLYPSMALSMFGIPDAELQRIVFAAYNDWIADFASYDRKRLLGVGLICVDEVKEAVAELERIARLELGGAMIAVDPGRPNYASKRYDPIWAAASDLNLPLSMHIFTGRSGPGYDRLPFLMMWMGQAHPVQLSIAAMLVSGVFERFPNLKVISVENDIGWIPHFLYRLEEAFEQFRYLVDYQSPETPIDYFHKNLWFTFQDDPIGVQHLEKIGANQVLWGSDYPHGDSTWPHSREIVERNFSSISSDYLQQVTYENLTQLYRFDA